MLDPMSLAEEERRLKEESELRELHETIALDDNYFASRDLSGKGRDVHTTARQRKLVQKEASTIKFPLGGRRRSTDDAFESDDNCVVDIDFNTKPRTFIAKGFVNRYEPDKILRKFVRRYLFVFNDVILITNNKDSMDQFDVIQVLWMRDLRIRHSFSDDDDSKLSFELINKVRNRPKTSMIFTCDNMESWSQWIQDLENVLLAYHRQTDLAKQIGWFHEVIQGNFHSASYLGDLTLLRKHLKSIPIDTVDASGMGALHWAVLRGHEVVTRFLIDRGAEVDVLQKGLNTPLLLAAACGYESIARLLIDAGADVKLRNFRGHDAVFMVVLYGHSSKGMPWLLQLLAAKGMDLNEVDSAGATALHLCAEKNLARPVRLLVDSGADVNARHARSQLTPIQLACSHAHPDMETIRSFLDKGAYPNWKDFQGRTAFDFVLLNYGGKRIQSPAPAVIFSQPGSTVDVNQILLAANRTADDDIRNDSLTVPSVSQGDRWRPMEDTLNMVGDWAVKSLPVLLELCKKGARFENRDLDPLRPSFRSAVLEAKDVWDKKCEPTNFVEFVSVREQSGEDLLLHRTGWSKNRTSSMCQLCSDTFGLTNRRHHCRACGILCCDKCSSKRLQLSSMAIDTEVSSKDKKRDERGDRVCDGCFNRLCHEASQPSADHFRIRQLKQCAFDVIRSIEDLIESLEDPSGEASGIPFAVRESLALSKSLESISIASDPKSPPPPSRKSVMSSFASISSPSQKAPPVTPVSPIRSGEEFVEVLRKREARLFRSEDVLAKFLESAVGYHHITKRLIESKRESGRIYGGMTNK